MNVFVISRAFTLECYRITKYFPADEKFGMITQIRRAALSVHLNIAEGCSRKSIAERKRYFEIARGSVIEIDTALDIAVELKYCTIEDLHSLGVSLVNTFKLLSGLIGK
jgi:four helix bundle protein